MSDLTAGYDLGLRHGYDIAVAELTHILTERMQAGDDIGPLLPLMEELRVRKHQALEPQEQPSTGSR